PGCSTQQNTITITQATAARLSAAEHRARKIQAARAGKTRSRKQLFMGLVFIALLAAGWLFPWLGYFIPVCMLLGIGIASCQGRSWCNWLCPRGSFEDSLLRRLSRQRPIPLVFRQLPLRLGVMALLLTIMTIMLIRLWPDPVAIGGFFVLMLTVTTAVAIILGIIYQQRLWCYLCPIGTMSSWVGKNRQPLALAAEKCLDCGLCAKRCPMQLAPASLKGGDGMANRGDCLKCSLCVQHCPTAALSWNKSGAKEVA
ncbi:MAG: 4Fe-4S binding protein, partial [Desulfobacca sp.]|uniref:4Fe-4S binding protein n=1 Tax=Desulfobacca sp. TaxID=2067990 RepID=UPI0040496077